MKKLLSLLLFAASLFAQAPAIGKSASDAIAIRDSTNLDAFGRLRSSLPQTMFDSHFVYDTEDLFWEEITSGSGAVTHQSAVSAQRLSVSGTDGDSAVLQTHQYWSYQAGRSQEILLTGVMGAAEANQVKRIGYFDGLNGIFFEHNGTDLGVVLRTNTSGSPVDTRVSQADWNLDPLDGTGPSYYNLDITKTQIFYIDFQWLGVGRVRMGFGIDGMVVPVHEFLNANYKTAVYMQQAALPLRYEITNTGTSSASSLDAICSTVIREGGASDRQGLRQIASNGATAISVTTRRPILSIRPKTTLDSKPNRTEIRISNVEIASNSQPVFWELVYNGSLSGASFASVGDDSSMERDVAATGISGGIVVAAGYVAAASQGSQSSPEVASRSLSTKVNITVNHDASVPDTFSLVATSLATATATGGIISWEELR